ncbi:MAG: hypothetical protein HYW48_06390 [Deltaproteobacteria bacterium]|nr:hypothetical protein [Deltaproteobacteria bacterium]
MRVPLSGGNGGAGGCMTGGNNGIYLFYGKGGTQTAGGATGGNATAGSLGLGGLGQASSGSLGVGVLGGGGGGGYYGGGGGASSGGGGGSSFIDSTSNLKLDDKSFCKPGIRSGSGQIRICWAEDPSCDTP